MPVIGRFTTVFSGRLPTGNLFILTQNVRGAGNLLIFIYDNFFCATLLTDKREVSKHFNSDSFSV